MTSPTRITAKNSIQEIFFEFTVDSRDAKIRDPYKKNNESGLLTPFTWKNEIMNLSVFFIITDYISCQGNWFFSSVILKFDNCQRLNNSRAE